MSGLRSDTYVWSPDRKPATFDYSLPLVHNHTITISWIANMNGRGKRATNAEQCMYWPCNDTMKTSIRKLRQRCGIHIFGTAVQFQPGQMPTVLRLVWVTNLPRWHESCFWPDLEPKWNEWLTNAMTDGGLTGPITKTSSRQNHQTTMCTTPWYRLLSSRFANMLTLSCGQ